MGVDEPMTVCVSGLAARFCQLSDRAGQIHSVCFTEYQRPGTGRIGGAENSCDDAGCVVDQLSRREGSCGCRASCAGGGSRAACAVRTGCDGLSTLDAPRAAGARLVERHCGSAGGFPVAGDGVLERYR